MDVLTPTQLVERIAGRANRLRIAVASDSESGKSVLVCELARALLSAGLVKVVCALTADVAGAEEQYGAVLTAGCNLLWGEETLGNLLSLKAERKEMGKENPPTLVILDDLAGEKAGNSAVINTLYTRGRHFNLMPIFLNQVANTELSPKVRGNCNIILFSSLTPSGVGILYDTFVLSPPMTKKELADWAAKLPRYTFGAYDRIDKCLLRVKADLRSGSDSDGSGTDGESGSESVGGAGSGRPRSGTGYDEKEAEREARRSARYGKKSEQPVIFELERHKSAMSYFRIRAETAMRMLEGGARDEDDNELSLESAVEMAKEAFGVIVRSFNPDGSCAIPNDWTTPGEVKKWCETEEEKAAFRARKDIRLPRKWLRSVGFEAPTTEDEAEEDEETVEPRAGAGLSAEDMLAAQMSAASLEETRKPPKRRLKASVLATPTLEESEPKLKVLSLFDGISCAHVALARAGFKDVDYFASEVDKHAIKITQKNWSDTHQLGNVLGVEPMDDLFLLIGGPPCQDLSIAKANRKGLEGERSSLFYEYVRLLKESKPTWFIMENVERMPKEARDIITAELGVEPVMINAALVSAQHRKRLFWTNIPIVGLPEDRELVLDNILETGPVPSRFDEDKPFTPKKGASASRDGLILVGHRGEVTGSPQHARMHSPKGKAPTLSATRCREVIILSDEQMRKLSVKECERLQGLDDDYTAGIADTHRFHAIGNAFHADVVAWILSFISRM